MEQYYNAKLFLSANMSVLGDTEMTKAELEARAFNLATDFVACLGDKDVYLELVEVEDPQRERSAQ